MLANFWIVPSVTKFFTIQSRFRVFIRFVFGLSNVTGRMNQTDRVYTVQSAKQRLIYRTADSTAFRTTSDRMWQLVERQNSLQRASGQASGTVLLQMPSIDLQEMPEKHPHTSCLRGSCSSCRRVRQVPGRSHRFSAVQNPGISGSCRTTRNQR